MKNKHFSRLYFYFHYSLLLAVFHTFPPLLLLAALLLALYSEGARVLEPLYLLLLLCAALEVSILIKLPIGLLIVLGQCRLYSYKPGFFDKPNKVGYTKIEEHVAIYYPCQLQGDQPFWMEDLQIQLIMFDLLNKDLKKPSNAPYFIVYLIFNFLRKIRMPANRNVPLKRSPWYPLAIFSHQLGSFQNGSATICMSLAAKGYIVLSQRNEDIIKNKFPQYTDNLSFRFQQVNGRVDRVALMLKNIDNILNKAFGFQVKVDKDNVICMGHSLGGSTMLKLALENGFKGKCILLDPCTYIIDHRIYALRQIQTEVPIFSIGTDFYQRLYPSFENADRLLQLNQAVKNPCFVNLYVEGMSHCNSADITLACAGFFDLVGATQPGHSALDLYEFILQFVNLILFQGAGSQIPVRLKTKFEQKLYKYARLQDGSLKRIEI